MDLVRTIDLAAPPARVWPLLTNVPDIQRWMPELVSDEQTSPGPIGVGTTSRMTLREGSRLVECASEIVAFQPERELAIEMRGKMFGPNPYRVTYELADLGGSTRLTYRSSWKPRGFVLLLMYPLIALVGRINLRRMLARLVEVARATAQGPDDRAS